MKNFFKRFTKYSFWVSLSGAVVILLNAFGKAFGFSVENKIVEDCIMAIAGVLVVLGVVGGVVGNTVMRVNPVQPLKTAIPIIVTPEGIIMSISEELTMNAPYLKFVTL